MPSSTTTPARRTNSAKTVLEKLEHARLPDSLHSELVEIYTHLNDAVQGLQYPLTELLSREIERAYPFGNAAVVLAVGVTENDTTSLRQHRIYLASALEMLRIAMSIHNILLFQDDGMEDSFTNVDVDHLAQNKGLIGSVILAGDYCFSRSAQMAAKTDDPTVVALFSQALKELSEEHLRRVFAPKMQNSTENEILFQASATAASQLAKLSPQAVAQNLALSNRLAHAISNSPAPGFQPMELSDLPDFQNERWKSIVQWLLDAHDPQ